METSVLKKVAKAGVALAAAGAVACGLAVAAGPVGQAEAKVAKPAKVKVAKATKYNEEGTKFVEVQIKKASRAKKYQVQIAVDKKFKKSKKSSTFKPRGKWLGEEFKVADKVYKKTIYTRARAKNASGWGKWSKVTKVKVQKASSGLSAEDAKHIANAMKKANACTGHEYKAMAVKEGFAGFNCNLLTEPLGKDFNGYDADFDDNPDMRIIMYNPYDTVPGFSEGHMYEYKDAGDGVTWKWFDLGTYEFDFPNDKIKCSNGETFSYESQIGIYIFNLPVTCEVCTHCGLIKSELGYDGVIVDTPLNNSHFNSNTGEYDISDTYTPGNKKIAYRNSKGYLEDYVWN